MLVTTAVDRGLSIAEAAEQTGLTAHTLRYYERDGLMLADVDRSASGHPVDPVYGPTGTAGRMARAYDLPEDPGMGLEFDFRSWAPGEPVRIGLVGYGKGGRFFHAPLIVGAARRQVTHTSRARTGRVCPVWPTLLPQNHAT